MIEIPEMFEFAGQIFVPFEIIHSINQTIITINCIELSQTIDIKCVKTQKIDILIDDIDKFINPVDSSNFTPFLSNVIQIIDEDIKYANQSVNESYKLLSAISNVFENKDKPSSEIPQLTEMQKELMEEISDDTHPARHLERMGELLHETIVNIEEEYNEEEFNSENKNLIEKIKLNLDKEIYNDMKSEKFFVHDEIPDEIITKVLDNYIQNKGIE